MCDECTWHQKAFLVQSVYWHLEIKLYCVLYCIVMWEHWQTSSSRQVLAYRCKKKKKKNVARKTASRATCRDWRLKADTVTVDVRRLVAGLTESQAQAQRWQKLFVVRAESVWLSATTAWPLKPRGHSPQLLSCCPWYVSKTSGREHRPTSSSSAP